jgi:hypothetical protein
MAAHPMVVGTGVIVIIVLLMLCATGLGWASPTPLSQEEMGSVRGAADVCEECAQKLCEGGTPLPCAAREYQSVMYCNQRIVKYVAWCKGGLETGIYDCEKDFSVTCPCSLDVFFTYFEGEPCQCFYYCQFMVENDPGYAMQCKPDKPVCPGLVASLGSRSLALANGGTPRGSATAPGAEPLVSRPPEVRHPLM